MFGLTPLLGVAESDSNEKDQNKPAAGEKAAAKRASAAKTKPGREKQVTAKIAITKEQEAAAMAFVKSHHSELLELLIHLKEGLPSEYKRAIRDLSRTSDRLVMFQKRDKQRYELELALWQTESKRQLLNARLQMTQDEELVLEIRETLGKEHELHLNLLKYERKRLADRVKKLDEQIGKQEKSREALIERKLKALTNPSKNVQRKVKNRTRKPRTSKTSKKPT
jgi:hypothetical protein